MLGFVTSTRAGRAPAAALIRLLVGALAGLVALLLALGSAPALATAPAGSTAVSATSKDTPRKGTHKHPKHKSKHHKSKHKSKHNSKHHKKKHKVRTATPVGVGLWRSWRDTVGFGGSHDDYDEATSVAVHQGSTYVAGSTAYAFADPGENARTALIKYAADGTRQWTRVLSATDDAGSETRVSVAAGDFGAVVVSDAVYSGPVSGYAKPGFAVTRFNPSGTRLWTVRSSDLHPGDDFRVANDVAVIGDRVFVVGRLGSGFADDDQPSSTTGRIERLSLASGALEAERSSQVQSATEWTAVSAVGGQPVVSGYSLADSGARQIVVQRFANSLGTVWTRTIGGTSAGGVDDGDVAALGGRIYLSGQIDAPASGSGRTFVAAYDGTGRRLWLRRLGAGSRSSLAATPRGPIVGYLPAAAQDFSWTVRALGRNGADGRTLRVGAGSSVANPGGLAWNYHGLRVVGSVGDDTARTDMFVQAYRTKVYGR